MAEAELGRTEQIRWCWKETNVRLNMHDASSIVGDPKDCWIAYSDGANRILEFAVMECTAGNRITSTCVPQPGYTVDLQTLKQRNDATGYLRDVQRVAEKVIWCWQETAGQWMDRHPDHEVVGDPKDCWIRYDDVANNALEQAYHLYQDSLSGDGKKKKKKFFGRKKNKDNHVCQLMANRYNVNFKTMQQTKLQTGFQRPVKRLVEQSVAPLFNISAAAPFEEGSLPPPMLPPPIAIPKQQKRHLAIIVVHFNSQRYQRRDKLLHECLQRLVTTRDQLMIQTASHPKGPLELHIVTVEAVFDQDVPAIQQGQYPGTTCISRRTTRRRGVLWGKEQLINIGWKQLPLYVQKICWVDADIEFPAEDVEDTNGYRVPWAHRVYHTLDDGPLYSYGQMWDTCILLGPDDIAVTRVVTSFAKRYVAGEVYTETANSHGEYWHPGFAWMASRAALEATDGLIIRTLGSADRHMSMAFLGRVNETVPRAMHPNYLRQVQKWESAVQKHNISLLAVSGLHIKHYWHGSLANRQYDRRWRILEENKFDPLSHIKMINNHRDIEEWSDLCPWRLIEGVLQYFMDRLEDSIEVEPVDVEDTTDAFQPSPDCVVESESTLDAGGTVYVEAVSVTMDSYDGGGTTYTSTGGVYNAFSYYA